MAGYVPEDKLQNPQVISYKPGSITIKYNEMELNEEILVGKGGALALYEGKSITMQDCIFMNNSAYNFGVSIFQASPVGLTITNVSFEASGKYIAEHGQVIYALSYLFISSASFVVQKALAHVSIVQHSLSGVMSLTIFNISLVCPVGYSLDVEKTTVSNPELYQGYVYGDDRDFAYLDRILLTCRPCKRGIYSIEKGSLELGTSDEHCIEVKILNTRASHVGHVLTELFASDIRSVPSYWGYIKEDEIILEHCIQGHCCYTDRCPGYDHCAENRHGLLFSQCLPGYSRATFSTQCVPSSDCGLWCDQLQSFWV